MQQRKIQMLFNILRSAISGERMTDAEKERIGEDILPRLKEISDIHDITPILEYGLNLNKILEKDREKLRQNILTSVYRYEQLNYEFEILCGALEEAKIDFIPLKGAVLRDYYPEPWMRTSCDIDIFIREEDIKKAVSLLVDRYEYTYKTKHVHEIGLISKRKKHIELHYRLIEEGRVKRAPQVLKNVWDDTFLKKRYEHWYELSDDIFYFYHIAHMAKHFENGGCGIRPFVDLWILDHIENADKEKRDVLLKQGELFNFAVSVRNLTKVWFEGAEIDPVLQQMENFIIRGGVYGSVENMVNIQQSKRGGRIDYVLSKIFIPYAEIKFHYPVLEKHRWLTPFMQIRRWCKLIFCGHARRSMNELKYSQSISVSEEERMRAFLESIGL